MSSLSSAAFQLLSSVSQAGDNTPLSRAEQQGTQKPGKYWIYEQVIRPAYYGIYEVNRARVEVYCLVAGQYQLVTANERGHYPISPWELSWEFGKVDIRILNFLGSLGNGCDRK